jgi:hypothetical protein
MTTTFRTYTDQGTLFSDAIISGFECRIFKTGHANDSQGQYRMRVPGLPIRDYATAQEDWDTVTTSRFSVWLKGIDRLEEAQERLRELVELATA